MFLAQSTDEGEEGIERVSREIEGWVEEERKKQGKKSREMFLMTLRTNRKTATQSLPHDGPLSTVSLHFSLEACDDRSPWSEEGQP